MSITEMKAQRREASAKAKIVKCGQQRDFLRAKVIRLTREIQIAEGR
jgi:hypothetical protein